MSATCVALVPARGGSQRVPGKNLLPLGGRPLIAWTVASAQASRLFAEVIVSTDAPEIAAAAETYGASVIERPPEIATAISPDVEWVVHAMAGRTEDAFAILRPTSPFRTAETLRRAWARFLELGDAIDSIRAVELCRQHPAKMWRLDGDLMHPVLSRPDDGTPWHSMQYQSLPEVYVQNSSLEIAWRRVLDPPASIAGERVAPFVTDPLEGLSIDYPRDVEEAAAIVAHGTVTFPAIGEPVS